MWREVIYLYIKEIHLNKKVSSQNIKSAKSEIINKIIVVQKGF
jgi:hypothetical protein